MKFKTLNKFVSSIATLALLINSLGAPLTVIAQEVTPEPAPTETTTPVSEPTVTPTDEPTATPVTEITPNPEVTVAPTDEAAPVSSEPVVTQAPESNPSTQGPPSTSEPATSNPIVTPVQPKEQGTLTTTVVENVDLSGITLLNSNVDPSPTLTTDQPDYSPTSVAIITGTGFVANKTYSLEISSTDQPPVTFDREVTADSKGVFTYAYQLDGNYRPNYKVEIKDGEAVIASATFTDSASPAIVWPTTWTTPNSCVTDPAGESGVSPTEVDLVGNTGTPTVGFSSDSNYFYFRERVTGNPGTVSNLSNDSWVVLFQTSAPQYQYLGAITGKSPNSNSVVLYDNPTHSPDSTGVDFTPLFNDPADSIVWSGTSSDYGRVTGSGPYFIDWAIPIAQLTSRGITTSTTKFFATSTNANNYNKDHLQCYDSFADLSITKSDSVDPVTSGGAETYTLSIHNAGPDTASGVIATDTLPAGFAVTTVTPSQGSCSDVTAPSIQCELGSMVNGANATVAIAGTLTGSGTVTDTANVSLDTTVSTDLNLVNNTDSEDTTINPAKGSLAVHKTFTDQHSNSGITINLTGTGTGSQSTNGTGDTTFSNLTPGTYTAHATEPSGYYESANTCINVSVAAGQTANCTITDSPILGTITVHKIISGTTTAYSSFCFTLSPNPGNGQVCANVNGDAVFSNIPAGTYTASETASDGNYTQTNTTCNSNMIIANNGDSKSCTVTNTRNQGKLELQKDFVGTSENVTIKIGTSQNGTQVDTDVLSADGTDSEHTVDTGTFFVSETLTTPSNYTSGLACYNDVNHNNSVDGGDTSHTVDTGTGSVTVSTNDDVICVFTNTRNTGSVKVNKLADTDGNGSFDSTNSETFTWSLDESGTNAMGGTVAGVDTGTHSVNESSVANYHLVGWYPGGTNSTQYSCTNLLEAVANHNLPASLSVTNGQINEITICNSRDTGTIKVHKDVVNPDGGAVTDTSHSFTVKLDGANDQSITDDGVVTYNNVVTGSHMISEDDPTPNYSLFSITPDSDGGTNGAQITVVSGQTIDVYVTNKQKKATITVEKNVLKPDGATEVSDTHSFSVTLNSEAKSFAEGDSAQFSVNPGSYSAVEGADGDYTFVSNDGPVTVDSNGSATIHIVNKQKVATITVIKRIHNPNGDEVADANGQFTFHADGQSTILGDDANHDFTVDPGNHNVTEDVNSNYAFVSCSAEYEGQAVGSPIAGGEQVSLDSNDHVTVTCINNQKKASITVVKQVVLSDGQTPVLDGHTFTAQLNGSNNQSFAEGDDTSYSVNPGGPYTIGEATEDNYTNLGCKLVTGAPATEMTLGSNQSVTVTCTNEQKPGSVEGYKFQADGSTPISGWVIGLFSCATAYNNCDNFVTSTVTDGTGFYSFTNLLKGFYQIIENYVSGYTPVTPTFHNATIDAEQGVLSSTDNNFSNFKNINIKVCKTDSNQTPLSGWEMILKSDGEKLGDTQSTDRETGCTTFENLGPGHDYSVTEGLQEGWTNISDLTHDFGQPADGVDQNYTFVNFKNINITACKIQDGNGVLEEFDQDQTTVFGWSIVLKSDGDQVGDSQQTGENGCTTFSNLGPGHSYSVSEVMQEGWTALDDTSHDFGQPSDGENQSYTFFNFKNISISGEKFNDIDGSGTLDAGEPGLSGWTINLENTDGNVLATTTTDSNGNYSFTNLGPGTYRIREVTQNGWDQKTDNPSDITASSGQNVTNVNFGNQGRGTIVINKNVIPDNTDTYFQFTLIGSLIKSEFFSLTDDGTRTYHFPAGNYSVSEEVSDLYTTESNCTDELALDPGETITCNFTNTRKTGSLTIHKIIDADGNLETTNDQTNGDNWEFGVLGQSEDTSSPDNQSTNESGIATFESLKTGNYNISEVVKPGYDFVTGYCEHQETRRSESGITGLYVANNATTECTMINTPNGQIHGFKWNDTNGDGEFGDENKLGDWTINLYKWDGESWGDVLETTTTDNTEGSDLGWYWFTHLFPGQYKVCEVGQNGWAQTYPGGDGCHEFSLPNDQEQTENSIVGPEYDFGNQGRGTVIVTKYNDANENGSLNPGETTLGDWTINLEDKDSQVTDESGNTTFENVPAGSHELSENLQPGWIQTNIHCNNDEAGTFVEDEYYVKVGPGSELHCYIGNFQKNPGISVAKSNDKGSGASAGDTVNYTLIVTNTGNMNLTNVKVTDSLPGGFSYVLGSSVLNGSPISDPSQNGNNLLWEVGNLAKDGVDTITYKVTIASGATLGSYINIAGCSADTQFNTDTLLRINREFESDSIVCDPTTSTVSLGGSQSFGGNLVDQVLGASTELPATGSPTILLVVVLGLLTTGFILKKKYVKN